MTKWAPVGWKALDAERVTVDRDSASESLRVEEEDAAGTDHDVIAVPVPDVDVV